MKRLFIFMILAVTTYSFASAYDICETCPTNNPMQEFYGDSGDYAFWTQEINWSNVINMANYTNGSDNFEKFKNARDELYQVGGGVLYYPAGTYTFDIPDSANGEGLMLKRGVVIRGEKPSSGKQAVTVRSINAGPEDHGMKNMQTKFQFTTTSSPMGKSLPGEIPKAWNCIGAKPGANEDGLGDVSHLGIAWVQIEYGYIWFGMGSTNWNKTWADPGTYLGGRSLGEWQNREPDGTHPMDGLAGVQPDNDTAVLGEKRFVFGCHLKNAAIPNYMINKPGVDSFVCDPESWRFGGKIGAYGEHIFIANNVIDKPTACFRMPYKCKNLESTISYRFDYGYGIGIDCNKSVMALFENRCYLDKKIDGTHYANDVIIQDNYIWNHGNKSIDATGKFLIIEGNVFARTRLLRTQDPYGIGVPEGEYGVNASNGKCYNSPTPGDMMGRGMDLGGWKLNINRNWIGETGCNFGDDGHGILFQIHTGIVMYSVSLTHNFVSPNAVRGLIGGWNVGGIGIFQGWNVNNEMIGMGGDVFYAEDVSVPKEINFSDSLGGTPMEPDGPGNANIEDFLAGCEKANISEADTVINLSVNLDETEYKTEITWEDNTNNEIAYRVEKRPAQTNKKWNVIAYCPRQETTSNEELNTIARTGNFPDDTSLCFPHSLTIDDMNKPRWVDYKTNTAEAFEYRVVAIDCGNNDVATPSGKIINKELINAVSKPVTVPKVTIRPNPVKTTAEVSYSLKEEETATVELLDMNGQPVKTVVSQTDQSTVTIPVKAMAPGAYLLKVKLSTGGATMKKLIIE